MLKSYSEDVYSTLSDKTGETKLSKLIWLANLFFGKLDPKVQKYINISSKKLSDLINQVKPGLSLVLSYVEAVNWLSVQPDVLPDDIILSMLEVRTPEQIVELFTVLNVHDHGSTVIEYLKHIGKFDLISELGLNLLYTLNEDILLRMLKNMRLLIYIRLLEGRLVPDPNPDGPILIYLQKIFGVKPTSLAHLKEIYYNAKRAEILKEAAYENNVGKLERFMIDGGCDWNEGMKGAAEGGHLELVKFFVEQGADYWNRGMHAATKGGHLNLVEYFIGKGADDWDWGLYEAAKRGHSELVEYFIELGADDWNWGMKGAAEGGHSKLVEYFIGKGADDWNRGLYGAAEGGHFKLVEYFIDKGADDWDWGMRGAAKGGHLNLVKFFISKGADDWNYGMNGAAEGGHLNLVKFFVDKGANMWNHGIYEALKNNHSDVEKFLQQKRDNTR